jgi:hypothetical protein
LYRILDAGTGGKAIAFTGNTPFFQVIVPLALDFTSRKLRTRIKSVPLQGIQHFILPGIPLVEHIFSLHVGL